MPESGKEVRKRGCVEGERGREIHHVGRAGTKQGPGSPSTAEQARSIPCRGYDTETAQMLLTYMTECARCWETLRLQIHGCD